jgi:hypothetical protein
MSSILSAAIDSVPAPLAGALGIARGLLLLCLAHS